jgi:hypothetical protein
MMAGIMINPNETGIVKQGLEQGGLIGSARDAFSG